MGLLRPKSRDPCGQNKKRKTMAGFHVMSLPPCWWTRTKDLSLAPFVRPPATFFKSCGFVKVFVNYGIP